MTIHISKKRRTGATLVEAAFVLPVLFLLLLGFMEMSQMGMTSQMVTNAAMQACRVAVVDGYSQSDVLNSVQQIMAAEGIASGSYTVTTNPGDLTTTHQGTAITVTINIPFRNIEWIPPIFLNSVTLKASATLSSERP
jgi:Flp pilus assembly protein TadG